MSINSPRWTCISLLECMVLPILSQAICRGLHRTNGVMLSNFWIIQRRWSHSRMKSIHDSRYGQLVERLIALREEFGVTQTELAGLLNKQQSYAAKVANFKSGSRSFRRMRLSRSGAPRVPSKLSRTCSSRSAHRARNNTNIRCPSCRRNRHRLCASLDSPQRSCTHRPSSHPARSD